MDKKEEKPATETGNEMIRLNRYIAMCGVCSRREADALIAEGRVSVDGEKAAPGARLNGTEDIRVDGRPIRPSQREIVLAVNKPVGVVCSTDRRWGDALIGDLIEFRNAFSIWEDWTRNQKA